MECKGIETLDGNIRLLTTLFYRFRWVFCQLETLRHCFPPNLRQFLNELPESLDETYERILKGINKAQKEDARRLLQCLTVAARPLRVEELAELLAFDFQATSGGGIPALRADWRWNDQEQAVLSTCSSLIAIVRDGDSRVVQFSHFSVKEYLTSRRLASSGGDVSRFHVDLNAAHTILAQACLGTLLRLDEHTGNGGSQGFPLVEYAAQHWVEHAQFEDVSSRVQDGMDDLFDGSKPYFSAWLRVHDIDEHWSAFSNSEERCWFSALLCCILWVPRPGRSTDYEASRTSQYTWWLRPSPTSGSVVQETLPCRGSTLEARRCRGRPRPTWSGLLYMQQGEVEASI
jgi:hypothetical protein